MVQSWEGEVGVTSRQWLGTDEKWFVARQEQEIFSSAKRTDRRYSLPNLRFIGTGGFWPVLKRPGREDDHSPPSSAEVNKQLAS